MAKKNTEEVVNGLVDTPQVENKDVPQPSKEVSLNVEETQVETPGHNTRAFRN